MNFKLFWCKNLCILFKMHELEDFCARCDVWISRYNNLFHKSSVTKRVLENEVESLQKQVKQLENRVQQLEEDLYKRDNDKWLVENDICTPSDLLPQNFAAYYNLMLQKYPLLQIMVGFFFSNWRTRKEKSKKTLEEWLTCKSLYKSFIVDMILKSRNTKAVLSTQLMLGVVFVQYNVPEPAWRLLQRFRVLPSRQYVENYLKKQPHWPKLQL